ncbi:MAG: N-acetyl-gamma-glutamyl-phosphate reductase [Paracoccaceae bacterium]|nr:N-acetyl-gamma-glutamyl-phosphate reductase [Paracoccaceae bacterium]
MVMKKIAIIGASGYTGLELVRIALNHPHFEIANLVADSNAGKAYSEVYPSFENVTLPDLISLDELDPEECDLIFCGLPHTTSQRVIKDLFGRTRIVDLSADFRLQSISEYQKWYGNQHLAPEIQEKAVYGLTEFYREEISSASLVACTGCNAATGLYPLIPLLEKGVISSEGIILDLKAGVSGAGRAAKVDTLFAELSEGCQPYNPVYHRHLAEFDQELTKFANKQVEVSFTPHLIPMNRGILATIYVEGKVDEIYQTLVERYSEERFIHVLPKGKVPSTRHVRGSNFVYLGVMEDRIAGKVKLFSVLDNLTKGSSGQAIQNANIMLGLDEGTGLSMIPLVP